MILFWIFACCVVGVAFTLLKEVARGRFSVRERQQRAELWSLYSEGTVAAGLLSLTLESLRCTH